MRNFRRTRHGLEQSKVSLWVYKEMAIGAVLQELRVYLGTPQDISCGRLVQNGLVCQAYSEVDYELDTLRP